MSPILRIKRFSPIQRISPIKPFNPIKRIPGIKRLSRTSPMHRFSPINRITPISIVIITLNEAQRIARLLNDLCEQTQQDFEVIVVDSNSEDDTCAIAERFSQRLPRLTVHRMTERGVCLGRNTGAQLAGYERLLFLDADVRLPPDFLAEATGALSEQQLDVAGVYLSAEGLSKHFVIGYKIFNAGIFISQFIFPTAIGACIFSTKTLHQALGGFDTTITLCEDCDYVNRATKFTRFRMLPMSFSFDPRRLKQDGFLKTAHKYLHANLHRLFIGEIRNQKIPYEFGHYTKDRQHQDNLAKR